MISSRNTPLQNDTYDDDYTIMHYKELLHLAKDNYQVVDYKQIPWENKFILWRHDMDYSLNRGLALAKAEHEVGVKATYFLNPHSEFYNIAEANQSKVINEILQYGHDIGLHFDSAYFKNVTENNIDDLVQRESEHLKWLFGESPTAFSFHNPSADNLECEKDTYGGLVNCYSRRFKQNVPYCSDSNGYWRFRRLHDVLTESKDPCLQVLTHPGWWHDHPKPPRQRIFRSVYGRATAIMKIYDTGLMQHGRLNHTGLSGSLSVLMDSQPQRFDLCDYLWNSGEFQSLFIELWRIHESQINRMCKAQFRKEWHIPAKQVNEFFGEDGLTIDGWRLFNAVFEISWSSAAKVDHSVYRRWQITRNQLIHGRSFIDNVELELGCVAICDFIRCLADWGRNQPLLYDGLAHLGSIGLPTYKTAKGSLEEVLEEVKDSIHAFPEKRWSVFKKKLEKYENVNLDRSIT